MIISVLALLLGISSLFFNFKLNNKIKLNDKNIKKNKLKIDAVSEWMNYYKNSGEKKINRLTDIINKKFNKNA